MSLSALGQSFAYTFHEDLRRSEGRIDAGPQLRAASLLSAAAGLVMAVIAVILWRAGSDRELWLTFAWLAPVAFLRTLSCVSPVVLAMQHRDVLRLKVTAVSLIVKVSVIALLSSHGGPGAAVAFLVADAIMSGTYAYNVYGRRASQPAASDG
jgi:O-antigen/teichoic acid export membrane protein